MGEPRVGFWWGNSPLQEEYQKNWNRLVPPVGNSGTLQGEILRAATKLYYRWYNDGDKIAVGGEKPESLVEAWGYLFARSEGIGGDLPENIHFLTEMLSRAESKRLYEKVLELLMEAAVKFASLEPIINVEDDYLAQKWREKCEQYCQFAEYDEDED